MVSQKTFGIKSPKFEKRKFQYKITKNVSRKQAATLRYRNPKEKEKNVSYDFIFFFLIKFKIDKTLILRKSTCQKFDF